MNANQGCHRVAPARPLVVQARESSPFNRKCRLPDAAVCDNAGLLSLAED